MNRLCLLITCLLCWGTLGFAGEREQLLREGVQAYRQGDFERSEERSAEALATTPGDAEALFNLGASQYRQEDFEGAANRFRMAAESGDPDLAPQSWYNLGNSQLALQDPQAAVESYIEALKRDPALEEARHNLELALRQLQQQEQQEQQQGEDGESSDEQEPQEEQDSDQQQDQGDQDQNSQEQPQDSQEQQEPSQDEQQQDDQGEGDDSQEDQPGQQEQPQPMNPDSTTALGDSSAVKPVSPEQLEQILRAVEAQEKEALEKQLEKLPASKRKVEKDW